MAVTATPRTRVQTIDEGQGANETARMLRTLIANIDGMVYRALVEGPDENVMGEAITADFPEVLAALVETAIQAEREALAA